jgi:hypothetical protein
MKAFAITYKINENLQCLCDVVTEVNLKSKINL